MDTQNLDFLKNNLKYMGFGEGLNPAMEKNIQQGFPEFTLRFQNEYGKETLDAQLHFRKSDQSDMYFFNRYDAKLSNDPQHRQTFYINKGAGVTLKEAFNLLSGRSVNKDLTNSEGQKYNAWVQLDFAEKDQHGSYKMKQFHQNYGYDLDKALSSLPIKELANSTDKERLVASLEKGNVQAVTFDKDGKQDKMFIEANPQFKTINVFDAQMSKMQREGMQQHASKHTQQQESAKENTEKQNVSSVKAPKPLIEKKRSSSKKGLSLS